MSVEARRYASTAAALGYARARPPVHPVVVERVLRWVGRRPRVALDVGCGAGASTRPLITAADRTVGLDPAGAMVRAARHELPGAEFVVAAAERLPLPAETVDLVTAAGSLDGADLEAFATEARRVLTPRGAVAVYDYSRGRRAEGSDHLDRWYDEFLSRCGRPSMPSDLRSRLDDAAPLALETVEDLVVPVTMTRARYIDYVLTDAADPADPTLRAWCEQTLVPVFGTRQTVEIDAYLARLRPT